MAEGSRKNSEPRAMRGARLTLNAETYFLAVSRAIVESECVMPMLSDMAGAIAEVSAPEVVVPFFAQPASERTAAITRIVFIVTP